MLVRRVVHLTSVHRFPDTRIQRECVSLQRHGYDVNLVVPTERDAVEESVKVHAVDLPVNRPQRMTKTVYAVVRKALSLRGDVYHFHDPELYPAGLYLAMRGLCVIYDAHEDFPQQVLNKEWLPGLARGVVSQTMKCLTDTTSRYLAAIVCAWPNIYETFAHKHMALVQNYPKIDEYSCENSLAFAERPNVAIYLGDISEERGCHGMLKMMRSPRIPADARLLIGGRFSDAQTERAFTENASSATEYVGFLDRAKIRQLLGVAKLGLCVLLPTPAYVDTMPTKMFEYMSAGVPVVISNFPRWRAIVEEVGCGIAVDPCDPDEIAAAVVELMNDPKKAQAMGNRGREAVRERFNWNGEEARLIELYDAVAGEAV